MFFLTHFPQKIYKLRQTKLSQFVYFLREREEIFFTYFRPKLQVWKKIPSCANLALPRYQLNDLSFHCTLSTLAAGATTPISMKNNEKKLRGTYNIRGPK